MTKNLFAYNRRLTESTFVLGLALIFTIAFGMITSEAEARNWTIMYYMIGEPDIEGPQIDNLDEMGDEGSNSNVQVVAQADFSNFDNRTKGNLTGNRRFSNTARFVVNSSGIRMTKDLGNLNAGDPSVLVDYMKWAISTYPADRYALIFDCHSSGVESYYGPGSANYHDRSESSASGEIPPVRVFSFTGGMLPDNETNPDSRTLGYDDIEMDCLTLSELEAAIRKVSSDNLGGKKLDVLGLASCVTQQIEFLTQIKSVVKYSSGSQSTSTAGVVDWESFMDEVKSNPRMGGAEFAKQFARHLIGTGFSGTLGGMLTKATASAFDLSKLDPIVTGLNDLSSKLIKIPASKLSFKGQISLGEKKRYWDLGNFLTAIHEGDVGFKNHSMYSSIRSSAVDVYNSISRAALTVWTVGGWNHKGLIGMGIYWPYEDRYRSFKYYYSTLRFAQLTRWDDFLNLNLLNETPSPRNMLERIEQLNSMDIYDDAVYEVRSRLVEELQLKSSESPEAADEIKSFVRELSPDASRGFEEFKIQ